MTLKELLLNTHFDDVEAYLKELYKYKDELFICLDYNNLLESLRHTEAIPSDRKMRISTIDLIEPLFRDEACGVGLKNSSHEPSIEEILGREIQIDAEITQEDAAARFLLETGLYGFSEEDLKEMYGIGREQGYSHFGQQAFELKSRHYEGLIYSKQEKKRDRRKLHMTHGIAFTSEIWEEINLHRRRCNPIRRKRNYRQKKRIAELEYKDKVEWLIQRLIANPASEPFLREDVDFLFSTSLISEGMFHSYANDKNARVDYLKESIEKYSSYEMQGYDRHLVLVTTASAHPARPDESLSFITNKFKFSPGKRVQWGYNYDDSLGEEMKVLIVMCDFKSDIKQKRLVQ